MTSPLDYKPKHRGSRVSHGIDGKTPRGPLRWMRAAANAAENPNSKAARLYHQRVALAHAARAHFGEEDKEPSVHLRWPYELQIQRGAEDKPRVLYYTCSLFCTTMQAQLDHSELETLDDLSYFYEVDERITRRYVARELYGIKQKAMVRCQVCATVIMPLKKDAK